MAAAGTSPALNLREKLAELAGLKQRVSPDLVRVDFTNLVTNGTFDTDIVGWTATNATLTNPSGRMSVADAGVQSSAYQNVKVQKGANFLLGVELVSETVAGSLVYVQNAPNVVGNNLVNLTVTVGTATQAFEVGATSEITLALVSPGVGTSVFDNVSLYEADPSDDAPWLRLPYGYKVGKRGMIVRDGVVLHPSDYTEITDSGQTWIKPITAPGVSTEFSIWAGA